MGVFPGEPSGSEIMNTIENIQYANNKAERRKMSLIRLGVDTRQACMWSRSDWVAGLIARKSSGLGTTITVAYLKQRSCIPFSDMYKAVSLLDSQYGVRLRRNHCPKLTKISQTQDSGQNFAKSANALNNSIESAINRFPILFWEG